MGLRQYSESLYSEQQVVSYPSLDPLETGTGSSLFMMLLVEDIVSTDDGYGPDCTEQSSVKQP